MFPLFLLSRTDALDDRKYNKTQMVPTMKKANINNKPL
jgi:hypothetical protein